MEGNGNKEDTVDARNFLSALICGGLAGTSVDVTLFPIDTLKTRLQSPQGFRKAGGFQGIYNGLGAAAIGSAPGAALFFSTYEVSREVDRRHYWPAPRHCAALPWLYAC
jgi:solute carrier family 25 (mitochondrial S-adenosylmethionine transporter), member 26